MMCSKSRIKNIWDSSLHRFFFVIPCLFYFYTACRTPGWVDATMIVSNTFHLELGSWVNTHNLFHLLGFLWLKLFPPTNIHFHLVLLSGLLGAVTVHFMFLTGRELTSHPISAAIGAIALMVSHSLWWHSAMLEVYTLNTALMSLMLYCVVRYEKTTRSVRVTGNGAGDVRVTGRNNVPVCAAERNAGNRNSVDSKVGKTGYLYLAVFFFGLGCSNHVLMGLFVFAFFIMVFLLLFRWKRLSIRHLLMMLICFLLGFQLYIYAFLRDFLRSLSLHAASVNQTWVNQSTFGIAWHAFREVLHAATGGDFKRLMFTRGLPLERVVFYRFSYFFWIVYNYASPAVLLGFWGFYLFWKKRAFRLSFSFFITGIAIQAMWSANYFIWDMYAFSLPVYVLFSLPAMLAVDKLIERKGTVRRLTLALSFTLLLPLLIYRQVPRWYSQGGFFRWYIDGYPETHLVKNTWDPVGYFANPDKRTYDKVDRYVRKLCSVLPQQAHLLNSDSRADYPLRYYHCGVLKNRTDIVHHHIFSLSIMNPEEGRKVARRLKRVLDSGKSVYTVSVQHPEKHVLDQLYLLYNPGMDPDSLESISQHEYLSSFPGVRFEKIVLFDEEEIWIYKIVPDRATPQPAWP
jgi:hypothetical protein